MGSGAGPLCAGATLRRADPPPQGRAAGPTRLAFAGQNGRAAAVRGGPRPRSDTSRLRRQAASDRTRRPSALPILRQAFLPCLLLLGLPALRPGERGARDGRRLIAKARHRPRRRAHPFRHLDSPEVSISTIKILATNFRLEDNRCPGALTRRIIS